MADGWWNLDGAITSCVAAYQAIGAASYAASLSNLFNPGTNDLTAVGTAPNWDATNGWWGNDQLNTGLTAQTTWSMFVKLEIVLSGVDYIAGVIVSAGRFGFIRINSTGAVAFCNVSDGQRITTTFGAHVIGLASKYGYKDGTLVSTDNGGTVNQANTLYINGASPTYKNANQKIHAVAIFNATLTAEEITALTAAMADLPGEVPEALTAADFTLSAVTFDAPTLVNVSDTEDLTAADLTLSTVTFDAPTLVNVWNTPACRTYSVESESRAFTISAESRGLKIVCNSTTIYSLSYVYNGLTATDLTLSAPTFDAPKLTSKLTDDLVAFWKMDEAEGNARVDIVGAHNLTEHSTDATGVPAVAGVVANAAQFNTANVEYLTASDHADLQFGDRDWTIDFWVYVDNPTPVNVVLHKGTGTSAANLELYLYCKNGYLVARVSNGTATSDFNIAAITAQTWTYICLMFDSSNNKFVYHSNNNPSLFTSYLSAPFVKPTSALSFGASTTGSSPMTGAIDDVGKWNRLLTVRERLNRWNNGSGNTHPFTSEILWDDADYPVQSGSFTYSSSIEA